MAADLAEIATINTVEYIKCNDMEPNRKYHILPLLINNINSLMVTIQDPEDDNKI